MDAEEEKRREEALAATPLLDPDFKSSKVTRAQIDKFKELHEKRLMLKERQKANKKHQGIVKTKRKPQDEGTEIVIEEGKYGGNGSSNYMASNAEYSSILSANPMQEETPLSIKQKKRQKLHWGLDAKERWERKSNM